MYKIWTNIGLLSIEKVKKLKSVKVDTFPDGYIRRLSDTFPDGPDVSLGVAAALLMLLVVN